MNIALVLLRIIVSATFVAAAIGKFADLPGSRKSMADFGLPKRLAGVFGIGVPVAELIAAAALIPAYTAWYGAMAALGLLLIFIIGISYNLAIGRKPDCHCFGQIHSSPIGWKTLVRNTVLAAAAAAILLPGRTYPQPEIWGWTALCAVLALNLWVLIYLLRQNGRLLLRIEAIEARLGMDDRNLPPLGLPEGSPAPEFNHEGITLKELLASGKPALLLFVQPQCGPCRELEPEIRAWQTDHEGRLTIRVISEDGEGHPIAEAYQYAGTPGAVLVRPDGTIGSAMAAGANAIRKVVRSATASF